jgi:HK97 family phage portal protein
MRLAPRETRSIASDADVPGLTAQLLAVQGVGLKPWLPTRPRDALSNPAVFRGVSLLANVAGSLSLEAFRLGDRMAEAPPLVRRPDPFQTPREFVRDSVYSLALWGEFLWHVGARDPDNLVVSLRVTNPVEWVIGWDERRWERTYKWRNTDVKPEDVIHGTFLRDLGAARGAGPLQLCGAALYVAQAADDWAARFFSSSGAPLVVLEHPDELDADEAQELKDNWMMRTPGEPAVTSGGIKATAFGLNPEAAQLTQSRERSVGDAARMLGIPGDLLEYAAGGSSLTYRNLGAVGDHLVRFTLAPNYLEPIEQHLSDLLTRTTVARFNVEGLLRADIETRYRVYQTGIASTVLERDEARAMEGLIPGGVETAPVGPNPANVEAVPYA